MSDVAASSTPRVGVGVISLGWMGRVHARAYRGIAEYFPDLEVRPRLVSACDTVAETRLAAVGSLGFQRATPDYREVMGFDDMKVIEAAQFLRSFAAGEQLAPSVADGWAAAEVDEAAVASDADGRWHDVPRVDGTTTYDI